MVVFQAKVWKQWRVGSGTHCRFASLVVHARLGTWELVSWENIS